MSSMARIGARRFLPACLAAVLGVAVLSSAAGQDALEEQQRKEHEALGREALMNRQVIGRYGYADYVSVFPIGDLSKDLAVKAGEVSLLPDPKDRGSGRIAVYLLNATNQPLPGAIAFRLDCFLEVKDGDRWRACESYIPGCGTGRFAPRPLAAGHGLVFTATDPAIGDMTGELRYCVAIDGSRPITSAPFQGRFSSKPFEKANPAGGSGGRGIRRGLDGEGWRDPRDGSHGSLGRFPEEWLAVAELDRCHDESLLTRSMLIRWQASTGTSAVMSKCRTEAGRLLQRPWDRNADRSSLFHRCFTAVTAKSGTVPEWGSPERCRPVVWRYLNEFRYPAHEHYLNPERWDQLEAIRKSGNPWGVDQKRVATLVEEAVASLSSPRPDEREAAGTFLQAGWITSEHLPDDRWWSVLEHDVDSARFAATGALKRMGKSQEAGEWLADHRDTAGPNLRWLWTALADPSGDFAGWELPVALRLLETSPLDAVGALHSRCHQLRDPAGKQLPAEFKEPLRKFLSAEADAKKLTGLPPPQPGEMAYSASRISDPRSGHGQLRSALLLLAAWEDPADTSLIRKFLDHPLAGYSSSNGGTHREYQVRCTAAALLKQRQEQVPEGVVFEERIGDE